jgi:hypothetical protein
VSTSEYRFFVALPSRILLGKRGKGSGSRKKHAKSVFVAAAATDVVLMNCSFFFPSGKALVCIEGFVCVCVEGREEGWKWRNSGSSNSISVGTAQGLQ